MSQYQCRNTNVPTQYQCLCQCPNISISWCLCQCLNSMDVSISQYRLSVVKVGRNIHIENLTLRSQCQCCYRDIDVYVTVQTQCGKRQVENSVFNIQVWQRKLETISVWYRKIETNFLEIWKNWKFFQTYDFQMYACGRENFRPSQCGKENSRPISSKFDDHWHECLGRGQILNYADQISQKSGQISQKSAVKSFDVVHSGSTLAFEDASLNFKNLHFHCDTLQHSTTLRNTLQHVCLPGRNRNGAFWMRRGTPTHCNTLQHTATHCNGSGAL